MNVYFLVEGKTERKVYPKWISYFAPNLIRVDSPKDARKNNYYLISGGGYPSILDNHLVDSVNDIKSCGNYDIFVLALDADETDGHSKKKEVLQFLEDNQINFGDCDFVVVPQVVCMETWFLGNRRIFQRNPKSPDFNQLIKHYNVSSNDPEVMEKPGDFDGTISDFHFKYLKAMLLERNIRYSKSRPVEVTEAHYISQLEARLQADIHALKSMRLLVDLFQTVRDQSAV